MINFKTKRHIIAVILLVLFQSIVVFAMGDKSSTSHLLKDEYTTAIKIDDNTIIIKGMINGKGPYRFYLDTGSSGSYVSNKVAKHLKLPFGSSRHVMLNEVPHELNYYRIQTLQIGNAKISDFEVGVTPLLNIVNQRFTPQNHVDGVIGFDAFKDFIFTLNVKAGTMTLKPGKLNPKDKNTFAFEYHVPALCILPITVQDAKGNKRIFKVMIDSGENSPEPSITMPLSMHKLPFDVIAKKRINYLQMTRNDEMFQSKIKGTATIGNTTFNNPILVHHTNHFEGMETYDYGLLGMGFIKSLVITFDQKSSLVKIE